MIDLTPTTCNLCNGKVIYISNAKIYGKKYGSGYCYYCTCCGAYVGTHAPRPKEAMGILANAEMRAWKHKCHDLFDPFWQSKKIKRHLLYRRLAQELEIPVGDCHFGYFDTEMLQKAYRTMQYWGDGTFKSD